MEVTLKQKILIERLSKVEYISIIKYKKTDKTVII